MLRGRTVVVGVSGGIAAYKACELVRLLQTRGATVLVVMTSAATEFVSPLTFQVLSGNPVVASLWGDQAPGFRLPPGSAARARGRVEHVDVAEAADLVVIAPATADLMARLVHGEAPDALTSMVLATPAPLVICPSMDLEMWRQPATQANVRLLRARGAVIVGPASGPLASGLIGPGRLADPETIIAAIEARIVRRESMKGLRVLISAGRTEEPIDPVRVLTNRSSGRMGVALAEAARDRGATVTLVAGGMSVDPPHGVQVDVAMTADAMQEAMAEHGKRAEIVLMAAAVADYKPKQASREKLKRSGAACTLELAPNPDILAGLGKARRKGQTLVGFALETSRGVPRARAKLAEKHVDLIVLNTPRAGIDTETNAVTLVESRAQKKLPEMSKREVAEAILDRVVEMRGTGRTVSKSRRGAVARARRTPTARPRRSTTGRVGTAARATRARRRKDKPT